MIPLKLAKRDPYTRLAFAVFLWVPQHELGATLAKSCCGRSLLWREVSPMLVDVIVHPSFRPHFISTEMPSPTTCSWSPWSVLSFAFLLLWWPLLWFLSLLMPVHILLSGMIHAARFFCLVFHLFWAFCLFINFLDSTYSRIIFLHLTYFTLHNMLTVHPCGCLW